MFGQGMALRGPPGSMAIALDGIAAEQDQILYSFAFLMLAVGISNCSLCIIVMSQYTAYLMCGVVLLGIAVWYSFCVRIVNKFKFVAEKVRFRESITSAGRPSATSEDQEDRDSSFGHIGMS